MLGIPCISPVQFIQVGTQPIKKWVEAIQQGEPLPFDPRDQIIYYVGPCPAKKGEIIGSCGPTTSGRMDAYAPKLMELGLPA